MVFTLPQFATLQEKKRGVMFKIIRKLIALRKRDKDDIAEEDAVLALDSAALGMT